MPHTIKVSVNEWAKLDRNADAELMTDGLSGCVAIAVRTDTHIGLTHVYSNADNDPDKFEQYIPSIDNFMAQFGGKEAIREVHLVRNASLYAEELDQSLTRMLAKHLIDKDVASADSIRIHRDNGCTIGNNGLYLCSKDNQAIYNRSFTNTQLEHVPGAAAGPLMAQLQVGYFDEQLMRFKALPSEVNGAPETGHAHDNNSLSTGVPFARRPSETVPAPVPVPVDAALSLHLPWTLPLSSQHEQEHAPLASAIDSQDPPNLRKRARSEYEDVPIQGQAPGNVPPHASLNDEQGPTKKRKEDSKLSEVVAMLDELPAEHDFSKDKNMAARAVVAFAERMGIEHITGIQPTRIGNTAVMIEGTDKGGHFVQANEALRSSQIAHYSDSSAANAIDAPQHGRKPSSPLPHFI